MLMHSLHARIPQPALHAGTKSRALHYAQRKPHPSSSNTGYQPNRTPLHVCAGMHVPSDSFGGLSPERKASELMRTLMTFIAARVVLAQLEGSGRGALGSYNATAFADLHSFLTDVPLKNGDEWLSQLMTRNSMLALRVMEVRSAYCADDFEWDTLQRVANREMQEANQRLLQKHATESFTRSMGTHHEHQHGGSS